jgi:signal transduction histidine kinase
MRSLYLRIWLTVLATLALFALVSGWLVQRHLAQERARMEAAVQERIEAWAELIQRTLPAPEAPADQQVRALQEWSERLRVPLALDDPQGQRIAVSETWPLREGGRGASPPALMVSLEDGRTLWVARRRLPHRMGLEAHGPDRPGGLGGAGSPRGGGMTGMPGFARRDHGDLVVAPDVGGVTGRPPGPVLPPGPLLLRSWSLLTGGLGLAVLVVVLFLAVAAGAWPVVRRLTRRLETLQQGVERFGAGALSHRVPEDGRDEVAAVAASFNRAAQRIETLVRSHQSLLANSSHELRSPLARLKMALAMLEDAPAAQRARLRTEIDTNIAELDALVEEVLLASRLDAAQDVVAREPVDLLALAAEEASRVGAAVEGTPTTVPGDERLLRRALRNLLENARRYGGDDILVSVGPVDAAALAVRDDHPPSDRQPGVAFVPAGGAVVRVCDRGPGVPEAWRERVFEPFLRLPGHAEREGGVGLGLALVRQIARRHGGEARCAAREGGGSCFTIALPR